MTSSGDANVGFFLLNHSLGGYSCATTGPFPYYRDAGGNFQVVCGPGPLSNGPHSFNASSVGTTTTWQFSVDGSPVQGITINWSSGDCDGPTVDGMVDLGNTTANLASVWSAMKEETTSAVQAFWPIPVFSLTTAFSVRSEAAWTVVPVGVTTRTSSSGIPASFGVEGEIQNASLKPDEIRVGQGVSWPSNVSVLWAPATHARVSVTPANGTVPLTIACSGKVTGGTGFYTILVWMFGDGSTAPGASPSHRIASAGDYNVTLQVTDSGGERVLSAPFPVHATAGSNASPSHPWQPADSIIVVRAGEPPLAVGVIVLVWRLRRRGR